MSKESLMEMLKKEYGISTADELNSAIEAQRRIDISVFCQERKNVERRSKDSVTE